MTPADFDTLFAYSGNCQEQLRRELLRDQGLFTKPFTTTSQYNTIQKLLAHCIGAEERWITARIQGRPLPVIYEERAADTIESLFEDARTIRSASDALRRSLSASDYQRVIPVSMPQWGVALELSLVDIFFHILNHENYHRGQVVSLLQQNGCDPPNFDYVFLKLAGL